VSRRDETPLRYEFLIDSSLPDVALELPGMLPDLFTLSEPKALADVKELSRDWEGFLMPEQGEYMTVAVFSGDGIEACENGYAGGTLGSRVGVAVFGHDDLLDVADRVRHELLHTLLLPADHIDRFSPAFLATGEWMRTELLATFFDVDRRWLRGRFYDWLEEAWLDEVLGRMPDGYHKKA